MSDPDRPDEAGRASDGEPKPFRDAEAWLAERGVPREPIRVGAPPDASPDAPAGPAAQDTGGPPVSPREAMRLAEQAAGDAEQQAGDQATYPDPKRPRLEDDVAEAVAFIRRSTSATPQAEGRVRDKLTERGWPGAVVKQALDRARAERLIDDAAMAAALVDERRRKGHAPARIRRDLKARGFDDATLAAALAAAEAEDPEAAAFAVANDKAQRLTGVDTETAFRRVAAHVARRGYPDGLARKVARQAVFTTRDPERTAGH